MNRLKLFPKFFFYTLGIMIFIVIISHGMIYLLAPQMQIALSTQDDIVVSINEAKIITEAVAKALPYSLGCSLLISVICSLLFSKAISDPLKKISASTQQMMKLDPVANCSVHRADEIGVLAQNVDTMYSNLLSTIRHLEQEKDIVREMEQAKVDFLRAASHELKTPVTALNATLENMILGVGKYQDYSTYLPECKEMVEQLSDMICKILEASRLNSLDEQPTAVDFADLVAEVCEPYKIIAAAHQLSFSLDLPESFPAAVPVEPFRKAISNILANAVEYTEPGRAVSVYMDGAALVIENECEPIPAHEIPRLFEPFYRPDFSRSRDSGGNGLGLYIVDTILKALETHYSFESMNFPKGMRFLIQISEKRLQ